MSEEAVVRIIMVDSTAAASGAASDHSTSAGMTTAQGGALGGINSDKLYREMSRGVLDTVQGFGKHLMPVVSLLGEIRDVLERDYDYSDKEYKEVQTQTSLLKFIGAALSGDKGAIGAEVAKGAGIRSSDVQMIGAMNRVNDSIVQLTQNLNPEVDKSKQGGVIRSTILGMASAGLLLSVPGQAGQAGMLAGTGGRLMGPSPGMAAETVEATAGVKSAGVDTLGNLGASIGAMEANLPSLIGVMWPLLIAGAGGALMSLLAPKQEKEKSTNELLADISANTDSPIKDIVDNIKDIRQLMYVQEVRSGVAGMESALAGMGHGDLPLEMEQDRTAGADSLGMATDPDEEWAKLNLTPEGLDKYRRDKQLGEWEALQARGGYGDPGLDLTDRTQEMVDTLIGAETPIEDMAPESVHPEALPMPQPEMEGPEEQAGPPAPPPGPEAPDIHPGWLTWVQPHHGPGWNAMTPGKLAEMAEVGMSPSRGGTLTDSEYREYLGARIRAGLGPPGFAQGGRVGTDTIPAMLSPGEVVVPRNMVEGGAVDHLRGRLPGFSFGGIVAGVGQMINRNISDTDPGSRIGVMGQGISAFGDTVGKALPVIGGFITGLGKGTEAVGVLIGAINESVTKYGEYSPQIAQAQAMVEVQQVMGDFRRSKMVENDLAKFVIAQGEVQQKYEDIKIRLLMQITPAITRILELVEGALDSGNFIGDAIYALIPPLALLAGSAESMNNMAAKKEMANLLDPATILLDRSRDMESREHNPIANRNRRSQFD